MNSVFYYWIWIKYLQILRKVKSEKFIIIYCIFKKKWITVVYLKFNELKKIIFSVLSINNYKMGILKFKDFLNFFLL